MVLRTEKRRVNYYVRITLYTLFLKKFTLSPDDRQLKKSFLQNLVCCRATEQNPNFEDSYLLKPLILFVDMLQFHSSFINIGLDLRSFLGMLF